jgi:hypothetical protein
MSPLSCHVFFAEKPTCRYNRDDHGGILFSGCPACSVLLALGLSDIVSIKSLELKRNNAKNVSPRALPGTTLYITEISNLPGGGSAWQIANY